MNKFLDFYKQVKPKITNALEAFNQEILKDVNPIIKDNIEAFAKLNVSGKMVRGALIMLGYSFNNQDIDASTSLACAYEIFETSILVHDDIIDEDNLRRGVKTISYYNQAKYQNKADNKHLGEAIGICIGDYGLYQANNMIVKNYNDNKYFSKLLKEYNDIVIKTIKGETIDVMVPFLEKNDLFEGNLEKTIMDIYQSKTACYSIVGPLVLGMILGGNTAQEIEDIRKFATHSGIAFQIQDDLLGIFSTNETLGKTIGSDIKEFKQTILYAYTKNTPYYQELLSEYGKEDYDINHVKDILTKSGAKDYAVCQMNSLYEESLVKLKNITWLSETKKEILKDFITYLKTREK